MIERCLSALTLSRAQTLLVGLALAAHLALQPAVAAAHTHRSVDGHDAEGATAALFAAEADRGATLRIHKAALGRALIYAPTVMRLSQAPVMLATASKIVHFARRGQRVALLETPPFAIYSLTPAAKLIDSYAIVDEDADSLLVDFSHGFAAINIGSGITNISKQLELAARLANQDHVLEAHDTVIESLYVEGDDLVVHQLSRVRSSERMRRQMGDAKRLSDAELEESVHLIVRLMPDTSSKGFVPKMLPTRQRETTFAVTHRRWHEGDVDELAAHWDIAPERGPIVFELARDIPERFVAPLREGILYWNRAFLRDVVVVRSADAPRVGLVPRHVQVRWAPWRRGYFEQSSPHLHPTTGEILGGEMFFSDRLVAPASEIDAEDMPEAPEQPADIGLVDFTPRSRVHRRTQADELRMVAAHEAGHMLGLRHNFAGGSDPHLPPARALRPALAAYKAGGLLQVELPFATTVMTYPDSERPLIGAYIRDALLPYDEQMVRRLYDDDAERRRAEDKNPAFDPWFCDDFERASHRLVGCQIGYVGPDLVSGALARIEIELERLPSKVLQGVVARYAPAPPALRNFPEALGTLSPQALLSHLDEALRQAQLPQQAGTRSLRVRRQHLREPPLSDVEQLAHHDQHFTEMSAIVGGLPGLLKLFVGSEALWGSEHTDARCVSEFVPLTPPQPREFAEGLYRQSPNKVADARLADDPDEGMAASGLGWLRRAVAAQLRSAEYEGGIVLDSGRFVSLNKGDVRELRLWCGRVADAIEGELFKVVLGRIALGKEMRRIEPAWHKPLTRLASFLVLAEGEPLVGHGARGQAVVVRMARLPLEARVAALSLLNPTTFTLGGWGRRTRSELRHTLTQRVNQALGRSRGREEGGQQASVRSLSAALEGMHLSSDVLLWCREQLAVLRALESMD